MGGLHRVLLAAHGVTGAREGHPVAQEEERSNRVRYLHTETSQRIEDEARTLCARLGEIGNHPTDDIAAAGLAGTKHAVIEDRSPDIDFT